MDAFYSFWFGFKSWREFPHPEEEDIEQVGWGGLGSVVVCAVVCGGVLCCAVACCGVCCVMRAACALPLVVS